MRILFQSFIILLLAFNISSCNKNKPVAQYAANFLVIEESYEQDWIEVKTLESKGFGKSIIKKVDYILIKAKAEKNYHQVFKALAYRSKYINQIEEESTFKILSNYESEIEQAEFPLKNLLHSATAELYFQYFNQNRWRFKSRTKTDYFDPQDLRTWSLERISDQITKHYTASLENKRNLSQFPTTHLEPILYPIDTNNHLSFSGMHLRDNLYDFLAYRALSYFRITSNFLNKSTKEFNPDELDIFSSYSSFIELESSFSDSNSMEFKTFELYQNLMLINKESSKQKRTILNLERLNHYYQVSNNGKKKELYEAALKEIKREQPSNPSVTYALANLYYQWGSSYTFQDSDSNNRWFIKKANDLIDSTNFKNGFGSKQCVSLKSKIERKEVSFKIEKVNLSDTPILFSINFRNIDKLYARIIRTEDVIFDESKRHYSSEETVKKLRSAKMHKQKEFVTKNPNDFQEHNTEQFIDGLDFGKYYLLLSTNKEFNETNSGLSYQEFSVSNLSLINRFNQNKNRLEVFVLNRKNGKAVENATVELYSKSYSYSDRNNYETLDQEIKTDKEGYALFKSIKTNNSFKLKAIKGTDVLSNNQTNWYNHYSTEEKNITKTQLFTDRAIYRPGQTVYFKGITYNTKGNTNKLKKQSIVEIKLMNVNNQEVSKTTLTSNDYGSVEGSFIIPNTGLTGIYRIASKNGSINLRVEEYKRPTFKIELDTINGELELNKQVSISGSVIGFAGNLISDADVSYRVVRNAQFPYWGNYRGYFPSSPEKEIAKGKIKTDALGKYRFDFLAKVDEGLNSSYKPVYNYELHITAVSPNGETQSFNSKVNISSSSFIISTNISLSAEIEQLKNLIIHCKNLDGKALNKKGKIRLIKLKNPETYTKPKYWNSSIDIQSIGENEYKNLFPKHLSPKVSDLSNLKMDFEINRSAINSNQVLDLYNDLKPGAYELQITITNKAGEIIEQRQRFELFNPKKSELALPTFESFKTLKNNGEPGEKAKFLIGSSLSDLKILYEIEHLGKIVSKKWITLNNEQKLIEIPIKEIHRGGFTVHFIGVHSNRLIQHKKNVNVPFTNKKLNLKLSSFRDKVIPGSKEEWSIQVSGIDNTKIQSELLLSMYDQSLDQFVKKDWNLNPYKNNYSKLNWNTSGGFGYSHSVFYGPNFNYYSGYPNRIFPRLNWFGFRIGNRMYHRNTKIDGIMMSGAPEMQKGAQMADAIEVAGYNEPLIEKDAVSNNNIVEREKQDQKNKFDTNPIRTNFSETVFFYPQVVTDINGSASFKFTMPDALTEWNFRAFAHSQNLEIGTTNQSIKTQKDLMVFPNAPRFFREEDQLIFSSLISNLSDKNIEGIAKVRFFNSLTMQPIKITDGSGSDKKFQILKGENKQVSWAITIPKGIKAITYRMIAETENFSDGEEKSIPVLLNRILVTESLPIAIRANEEKKFLFKKLKESGSAKNLEQNNLSLEFTPNPVWYAIQALPYLDASGKECSEQVFTRYYANSIAEHIANSQPRIQSIFKQWKQNNSQEIISKLEQNQELKSALIEETPWLQEAQSETEQKRRIALLFDFNRMAIEKETSIKKLNDLQSPNGGWAWYKGMRDNRYITQYIVSGFGHLKELGINKSPKTIGKAIKYIDSRIQEDYNELVKHGVNLETTHLNHQQIQYLYARSFFKDIPFPENKTAFNYYLSQSEKYWLNQSNYMKGMIALALNRFNSDSDVPNKILISLAENSILDDEIGMYWKDNVGGYYWQNAKIETQALLIEAFDEIGDDKNQIDNLKLWLLKQKQTQSWPTSRSTAEACYALLIRGTNLIQNKGQTIITLGNEKVDSDNVNSEAGTGYFKTVWNKDKIKPEMGEIKVLNISESPAWGAVYWQYYQNLNDITSATESDLKLSKTIFKSVLKENGEVLIPTSSEAIKLGDKIVMRIRIESDRDLEFVHLKDMRASGFEPIDVLSGYKYQDGLGYYQSTKDASSNFYIDYLNKGVYVFEYAVRATIAGQFSNGISTIQCQYAPEFSSHSQGRSVKIIR
jgi:uncharacterized protein YfaS (alpha-2-macroglobulin family)